MQKPKSERSGMRRKHHVTLQLSESGETYTTLKGAGIRDFIVREVIDVHLLDLLRTRNNIRDSSAEVAGLEPYIFPLYKRLFFYMSR